MPKSDAYPETLPWRRRFAAAGTVIAAHLALLISIKTQMPPVQAPPAAGQTGQSIEIVEMATMPKSPSPPQHAPQPAEPAPAPAPLPPQPDPATPDLIEHPETLGLPAPSTDLQPVTVDGGATPDPGVPMARIAPDDPCHFTRLLQEAMQENDAVLRALTLVPRASRSVANAIMVWNGRWISVNASAGDSSFNPVRVAIVNSLRASSADCLARFNTGPLFITIPGRPETTVLAVGSGRWRVSDLIAESTELDPGEALPGRP